MIGLGVREDILALAKTYGWKNGAGAKEDILGACRIDGVDATDFLLEVFETHDVDYSAFRWEFHYNADEPPGYRRVVPVGTDGKIIPYIPITLAMLEQAARDKRWPYPYPPHQMRIRLWPKYAHGAALVLGVAVVIFLIYGVVPLVR